MSFIHLKVSKGGTAWGVDSRAPSGGILRHPWCHPPSLAEQVCPTSWKENQAGCQNISWTWSASVGLRCQDCRGPAEAHRKPDASCASTWTEGRVHSTCGRPGLDAAGSKRGIPCSSATCCSKHSDKRWNGARRLSGHIERRGHNLWDRPTVRWAWRELGRTSVDRGRTRGVSGFGKHLSCRSSWKRLLWRWGQFLI